MSQVQGKGPNGAILKEQGGSLKGGWGDHNGHRCPRSTETNSKQQEYSPTICINVPGLWLPLFLLLWLPWVHKFTWASSFFFWSSACTFTSFSTSLSRCRSFSEDGAKAERNPGLLNHNKVICYLIIKRCISYSGNELFITTWTIQPLSLCPKSNLLIGWYLQGTSILHCRTSDIQHF